MSDVWIPSLVSAVGATVVVMVQLGIGARNRVSLERVKAELIQVVDRRRSLYERRATVLAAVYSRLVDAHEAYEDFLSSGTRLASSPTPEQRHKTALAAGEDFRRAYTRARILLPKRLTELLDDVNREFVSMANTFIVFRVSGEDENASLMRVYKKVEGSVRVALADLESAFRAAIDGRE